MTTDLKAQIDAIPDGARVRWTREAVMDRWTRADLHAMRHHGGAIFVSVEAVTPSDDEVCASLLPDERITFDVSDETFTHWTFLEGRIMYAGPYMIRDVNGTRVDNVTNIRRVQP